MGVELDLEMVGVAGCAMNERIRDVKEVRRGKGIWSTKDDDDVNAFKLKFCASVCVGDKELR